MELKKGMYCKDANGDKVGPMRFEKYDGWEHGR